MGNAIAVCLVTDNNYMLPTVVAALQARKAITVPGADVIILAMGLDENAVRQYGTICELGNLKLLQVNRDVFGGSDANNFIDVFLSGSKFTFGALGRLFLDQLIEPHYEQILYIDGDIQIRGSLDELLQVEVPAGRFMAASDPKAFWIHAETPRAERERRYMRGLGLDHGDFSGYFNSGVLRINRRGWRDIGLSAWEFLRTYPDRCVCHDQSALNAAGHEARLPMSLKWNFPPFYRYYGLDKLIDPCILHFMSHPKPWNGAFLPWSRSEHQPYLDFVDSNPAIAADLRLFSTGRRVKYLLQQRVKWLDELVHAGRRRSVVDAAVRYEQTVVA